MTIEEKANKFVATFENIQSDSEDNKSTRSSLFYAYSEGMKEATRWIPIEESLPEDQSALMKNKNSTKFVLIKYKNRLMSVCHRMKLKGDKYFFWTSIEEFEENKDFHITHWRPIEFE